MHNCRDVLAFLRGGRAEAVVRARRGRAERGCVVEFGDLIAGRLAILRRRESVSQEVVAEAIGLSISGVSRLERGLRHLRVDQLVAWAGALGLRVDIVVWRPVEGPGEADAGAVRARADDHDVVLAEVAAALPHLPEPVKRATVRKMREWKEEALRGRRGAAENGAPLASA